ncbi:MAG TPA: Asp-tRNA(Asn)/Glu-tRNA(Gln) amidotransferase subunit GatC [Candidatus Polarisedimenticolia bacterium]|nr:Asp-tRNA(Asn)/Glu-tRNA(Gln) amidotransferase subunit GatC [Candidatus Polarisedimenticolia bacterium]
MKITLDEVKRIAALAQLDLTAADLERMRGQLDQILRYVDHLAELDTTGVEPAEGLVAGGGPPLREDEPAPCLPPDEALANAPESGAGHFKVPKVIG